MQTQIYAQHSDTYVSMAAEHGRLMVLAAVLEQLQLAAIAFFSYVNSYITTSHFRAPEHSPIALPTTGSIRPLTVCLYSHTSRRSALPILRPRQFSWDFTASCYC